MKTINIDERLYNRIKRYCVDNNLVLTKRVQVVLRIWMDVVEQEEKERNKKQEKELKKEIKNYRKESRNRGEIK